MGEYKNTLYIRRLFLCGKYEHIVVVNIGAALLSECVVASSDVIHYCGYCAAIVGSIYCYLVAFHASFLLSIYQFIAFFFAAYTGGFLNKLLLLQKQFVL